MNAYDIQVVLIANLNALSGLPINSRTLHLYKDNVLKSVKDIAESGAPIHMESMTETKSMQLYGSGMVLLHIFYAMCLHWVPKITTIFEDKVTTITKDGLINNENYPLNLGPFKIYLKDGELEVEADIE